MMKEQYNISHNQAGFTLIEVLIAVVVFTIGILSANAMQISSIKGNSKANRITESANWASDKVENLLVLDYDDSEFDDDDGDGTDQDGDSDGVDDDGGNFGLDDIVNPDGNENSPDGIYTIYWNVAVDCPMPNIKTVKIIVARNDSTLQKNTGFQYFKINTF